MYKLTFYHYFCLFWHWDIRIYFCQG